MMVLAFFHLRERRMAQRTCCDICSILFLPKAGALHSELIVDKTRKKKVGGSLIWEDKNSLRLCEQFHAEGAKKIRRGRSALSARF
jgi:5-methylcytosine-specific restriction endonuclease McrA